MITDCHIHIQPFELLLNPPSLEVMRRHQPDFDQVLEFTRSPKAFLKYMDAAGLDRAVLINSASPEVTGYPPGLNARAAEYVKEDRGGCSPAAACTRGIRSTSRRTLRRSSGCGYGSSRFTHRINSFTPMSISTG